MNPTAHQHGAFVPLDPEWSTFQGRKRVSLVLSPCSLSLVYSTLLLLTHKSLCSIICVPGQKVPAGDEWPKHPQASQKVALPPAHQMAGLASMKTPWLQGQPVLLLGTLYRSTLVFFSWS